ncbi:MAG: AAA family ATPase [Candidatus Thermoplasmatota archaeon]|jgi:hypothetical protein|nr:AAA family ATPase [Candidatus Thermoplasmatota archaeon]
MQRIVVASMRQGAGKTSFIIGLAKALKKDFGYMKPFGERIVYRKKRLLDYDSSLIKGIFSLPEMPEDMSIGFDHSKLRYIYDSTTIVTKLNEMAQTLSKDKDILIVEAGKDITYGASVNLDCFSLAKALNAKLLLVVSGDDDSILDDITYLKKHMIASDARLLGVIINKVKDVEDFKENSLDKVKALGVDVLGIVPFEKELTYLSVEQISDVLFAKVLAGERNIGNQVREIFIGAMSGDTVIKNPLFSRERKLIITSGDRNDLCLAALESDTSAIILTNNIIPPSNIITLAESKGIPLLLVSNDTFSAAKQVDDMEHLVGKGDSGKISLLERQVGANVDLERIVS